MKKTVLNILRIIFTTIFTCTYFISLSLLLTLFVFKDALKNDMIKEIILNIMPTKVISYETDENLLAYLDVNDIMNEINNVNPSIEIDGELEEYLTSSFGDVLKEYNIPEDTLKYVMEDEENKEIIADIMQDTINYSYGLSDDLTLKESDIEKLINNSIDIYENKTNKTIDREEINDLSKQFTKEYKRVLDSNEIGEVKEVKEIINTIFDVKLFYYILGVCIISFILLIVINIKNIKIFLNLSLPMLINGITYISIYFTMKNLDISKNLYSLQNSILKVGSFVGILGLIILIIFLVINYKKKEKEKIVI